jgi:hypothetical protein
MGSAPPAWNRLSLAPRTARQTAFGREGRPPRIPGRDCAPGAPAAARMVGTRRRAPRRQLDHLSDGSTHQPSGDRKNRTRNAVPGSPAAGPNHVRSRSGSSYSRLRPDARRCTRSARTGTATTRRSVGARPCRPVASLAGRRDGSTRIGSRWFEMTLQTNASPTASGLEPPAVPGRAGNPPTRGSSRRRWLPGRPGPEGAARTDRRRP